MKDADGRAPNANSIRIAFKRVERIRRKQNQSEEQHGLAVHLGDRALKKTQS
jgi:hypothetical protein